MASPKFRGGSHARWYTGPAGLGRGLDRGCTEKEATEGCFLHEYDSLRSLIFFRWKEDPVKGGPER
jgi:hypothetical protein